MQYFYAKPWIDESDIEAVTRSFREPLITRGPLVTSFEEVLAAYCGAEHAVAFNSGTSALHAAYFAAELSPYDHLITSPNTYIGTVTGALVRGVKPLFVDIDRSTGSLSLGELEAELLRAPSRGRTFLVPVHFSGASLDMRCLSESLCEPDTVIIEDACHALGGCYPSGERVGSCRYSDMTVFSFHPAKSITTGEGGAVLTSRADLAQRLRLFRGNGIERDRERFEGSEEGPWIYEAQAATGIFHITESQAALGLSQMKRLDLMIKRRRKLSTLYRQHLEMIPHVRLFSDHPHSAHHLMVVQVDFAAYGTTRERVMEALSKVGIGTQVHFIPLYRQPILLGEAERFPQMEQYYAQALTLPLYYELEERDVTLICNALVSALEASRQLEPTPAP